MAEKMKRLNRTSRRNFTTYGVVILAYVILQFLGSDVLK